ncbi:MULTISPECIES: hypothetical protein, partial [unclassified Streptomyces]|uniref:hypothetical protein n=1 Tax=unclassified Streptomyces TaxID=2593676 RepID=UPI001C434915
GGVPFSARGAGSGAPPGAASRASYKCRTHGHPEDRLSPTGVPPRLRPLRASWLRILVGGPEVLVAERAEDTS